MNSRAREKRKKAPSGEASDGVPPRPAPRRPRWRFVVVGVVAASAAGSLFAWRARRITHDTPSSGLPLPDVTEFSPDLRGLLMPYLRDVHEHPDDPEPYGRLGRTLEVERAFDAARQCFDDARQLDPQDFEWWHYRAMLDQRVAKYDEAIAGYRRVVALKPDFAPAYYHLGRLLTDAGQLTEAESALQRFAQLEPGEVSGLVALGALARAQGRLETARRLLEQAIRIAPRRRSAHHHLGFVYRDLGDRERARKHLRIAQRLGVDQPPYDPLLLKIGKAGVSYRGLLDRAVNIDRFGRTDEALDIARRVVQSHPEQPFAQQFYGWLCLRKGDLAEAEKHLRASVALAPKCVNALSLLAGTLLRRGKTAEANQWQQKAVAQGPDDPDVYHNRAIALAAVGELARAAEAFRKAAEADKDNPSRYRHLGTALLRIGRTDEAIAAMRDAVRVGEYDPDNFVALARALIAAGRDEEAAENLREATRLMPSHGEAHFRLACVSASLGRTDEAIAALQESVRLGYATPRQCAATAALAGLRDDPRYRRLFATAAPSP